MTPEEFQAKVLSHLTSISNGIDATGLRLNNIESRLNSIDIRLEKIEDRLRKIEKFVPAENADLI